jgi:predicted MFS family arabinose efflux permease
VVLALTRRLVDETPRRPGRFDIVGAVTATGGAVTLVWTLIGAPDHGWTSMRTILGFAAGLVLLALLARTERRVDHPLLRPALLRNRNRVGALAIMALMFGGQLSMFFLAVQFIEHQLGFGPMASGLAFLPLTVGIFAMAQATPRLLATVGPLPMFVVGTLGLTSSFVWLSQLDAASTYLDGVLGPMLLNGLSAALVFMPATSIVLGGVEPEHAGAASGLLQTFQQLGGAVGLAVIVSVYAAGSVPGEFLPGARAAFLTSATMAALAGIAAVAALATRRAAAREADEELAEVAEAA